MLTGAVLESSIELVCICTRRDCTTVMPPLEVPSAKTGWQLACRFLRQVGKWSVNFSHRNLRIFVRLTAGIFCSYAVVTLKLHANVELL